MSSVPELYTPEVVRKLILHEVDRLGSMGALARTIGSHQGDIASFLSGRRPSPPKAVLDHLGLTRVLRFERRLEDV